MRTKIPLGYATLLVSYPIKVPHMGESVLWVRVDGTGDRWDFSQGYHFRGGSDFDSLATRIRNALYRIVSSSVVDSEWPEAQEALREFYESATMKKVTVVFSDGWRTLRFRLPLVGLVFAKAVERIKANSRIISRGLIVVEPYYLRRKGKGGPENKFTAVPEDSALTLDEGHILLIGG